MISSAELIAFYRRVGMSLRSGIDARRVWEQEATRGSARYRAAAHTVLDHIKQGEAITAGMQAANFFPPVTLAMVEIGEHTGKLDEALARLGEHYERQVSLQRQFVIGI